MADWTILVAGYGGFLFNGTEQEAEEMRRHKSRWERGIGIKRPASADEVKAGTPDSCWNHAGFNHRFVYANCRCSDENCVANAYERIGASGRCPGLRSVQ